MPDQSVNPDVKPFRAIVIVDIAAEEPDALELTNALCGDVEARGMFVHFVTLDQLESSDVHPGTPLHEALTGEPASG